MKNRIKKLSWVLAFSLLFGACADDKDSSNEVLPPKEQSVDADGNCTPMFIANHAGVLSAQHKMLNTHPDSNTSYDKLEELKGACENFSRNHRGASCKAELDGARVNLEADEIIAKCSEMYQILKKEIGADKRNQTPESPSWNI